MKKVNICLIVLVLFMLAAVVGCTKKEEEKPEDDYDINYLVLVNKLNPLQELSENSSCDNGAGKGAHIIPS